MRDTRQILTYTLGISIVGKFNKTLSHQHETSGKMVIAGYPKAPSTLMRFRLKTHTFLSVFAFPIPSTLTRSKTEVYVCENGGFRKRSLEWRILKTEVQRLVDERKRRFSVFVWTGENGGFRKRFRHWHWHVPVKKPKRMFFYPFSVVKCGRSKTLHKR